MGFYLIGCAAITIGIIVVVILNITTPFAVERLALIKEGMRQSYESHLPFWLIFLLRFVIFLFISYLPIVGALSLILRPVADVIQSLKQGRMPDQSLWALAGRRLLNLPFRCVPISIGLWIILPAIIFHYSYFAGIMDYKTALILSIRSSMVGLIASAIASHRLESYSRQHYIPFFFPKGGLTGLSGVVALSIKKRIRLVYLVGCLVPMTILLVTLLTLQWELANEVVTARAYGRGILIFSCVLMIWVLGSTTQMSLLVSRSITDPLRDIIKVLKQVRLGNFKIEAPVVSNDEIGYAAETINEMTEGLLERDRIRGSLELAEEVQQNLLPKSIPQPDGFQVGAASEYCDETGGDYYDFIEMEDQQPGTLGVVLGDVAGHGISSALLMATARAFFRQRALQGGDLASMFNDVNRLLSRDTAETGQFMTMIYVVIDSVAKTLQWVRAGHDPGCLYDPELDACIELKGPGIPLGAKVDWVYDQQQIKGFVKGQVLILGTDGIWEARDLLGEYYGKQRLEDLVRRNADRPAQEIVATVMADHKAFRSHQAPDDDVTLLIIKAV